MVCALCDGKGASIYTDGSWRVCERCGGGDEVQALRQERDGLAAINGWYLGLLRQCEWASAPDFETGAYCPVCHKQPPKHTPLCGLAEALEDKS